jgi:hypothetical protein
MNFRLHFRFCYGTLSNGKKLPGFVKKANEQVILCQGEDRGMFTFFHTLPFWGLCRSCIENKRTRRLQAIACLETSYPFIYDISRDSKFHMRDKSVHTA